MNEVDASNPAAGRTGANCGFSRYQFKQILFLYCIHVSMCMCMYMYIYIYTDIHIIYIHIYISINIYIYDYIYICTRQYDMLLKFKLARRVDLGKSTTQSAPVST